MISPAYADKMFHADIEYQKVGVGDVGGGAGGGVLGWGVCVDGMGLGGAVIVEVGGDDTGFYCSHPSTHCHPPTHPPTHQVVSEWAFNKDGVDVPQVGGGVRSVVLNCVVSYCVGCVVCVGLGWLRCLKARHMSVVSSYRA